MRQNAPKFVGTKLERMDGMMNSRAPVQKDLGNLEDWATETSRVSMNRSAKFCTSSRKPPCMRTVWEGTGWIAALRKKNWGLWWALNWMQAKGECKWNYVTKGNIHQSHWGRFRLDMRNFFFTRRVVQHWNRLARGIMGSPSSGFCKTWLDKAAADLIYWWWQSCSE